MGAAIESSYGDIDVVCAEHKLNPGEPVKLVFRGHDDITPPFQVKITSPSGALILDRVLQELPTGAPQSAPPVTFNPSVNGSYKIVVKQVRGTQQGEAKLKVG